MYVAFIEITGPRRPNEGTVKMIHLEDFMTAKEFIESRDLENILNRKGDRLYVSICYPDGIIIDHIYLINHVYTTSKLRPVYDESKVM